MDQTVTGGVSERGAGDRQGNRRRDDRPCLGDDIKELNKPLPRWWLLTFYVSILWAVGYWIAYPAWPTLSGYTRGVLDYSQRRTVAGELQAARDAQAALRNQIAADADCRYS